MSVDYAKLKTNLNLIMHRLKLVEKKKMELNQKARRTIGDFLNGGKVDRARIRVEQIIREDYIVEAMDLIESYCDFLLSRFGQLQASEVVEEGLAGAVSSIIWAAPRFESDVPELKVIAEQLGRKYGKQYVQAVRENQLKTVNENMMKKMGLEAPAKVLVEKYLVEIAKDQKIDYKPDPKVMKEQEANDSAKLDSSGSSLDDSRRSGSHAPQGGFNLIDLGDHYPANPITQPFNPYGQAPPLPSEPPQGSAPVGPLDVSASDVTDASAPSADIPIGFNLPNLNASSASSSNQSQSSSKEKSVVSKKSNDLNNANGEGPPPNYDSVVNKSTGNQTQYYSFGQDNSSLAPHHLSREELNDTLPELPPVPSATSGKDDTKNNTATTTSDDLDDLTRRFDELKNKKN